MTVVEMKVEKKPYKVTERLRLYRKGIMAATLKELIDKGEKNNNHLKYTNSEL